MLLNFDQVENTFFKKTVSHSESFIRLLFKSLTRFRIIALAYLVQIRRQRHKQTLSSRSLLRFRPIYNTSKSTKMCEWASRTTNRL